MKLELDNNAMKGLVSEAIFQSFDMEKREALIRSALEALLQPARDGYGKGKSPLQQAFEEALYGHARRIAEDAVQNRPEIAAEVDRLVMDAMRKFVTDQREAVVDKMADAMRKAITGDRY